MQKNFDILTGHTIVCGYGRNGRQTVKELISHNHKVLVIENNVQEIEQLKSFPEVYYLVGDATNDDILQIAGVSVAKALITTLPKDADNLFVILTARVMNRNIKLISRASAEKSQKKLLSAGANEVIMPDKLGGQRMALLTHEPDLIEFLDYILLQDKEQVNLEELAVNNKNSSFVKKTIRELNARNVSGANIIGLKSINGNYLLNPQSDYLLDNVSHIFALGTPDQISRLWDLITHGE